MKKTSNHLIVKIAFSALVSIVLVLVAAALLINNEPVIIQGRIECQTTTISGKLLGRIDEIFVKEGETVTEGDTLVSVFSPEIQAQLESASAMESVAYYQNKKVDAGTRKEIVKSLKEAYHAAEANYNLAEKSLERSSRLFADSIITRQKMDEIKALYKNAEAAKKAAKYQYEMAEKGAQKEDLESSKAMVAAAKGNVNSLESLLADTFLKSPVSGEVSSIYLSKGELVMPGSSIMEVMNTDDCHVVLNIRENYLQYFYLGSEFFGTVPAFNYAKLAFEVFYISPMGSFANWTETKDGNTYNRVTFQIKARPVRVIDTSNDNKLIKHLRPGMSILVELEGLEN